MKNYIIASMCMAIATMLSANSMAQEPFQALKEHAVLKKDSGVWNAKGKMWIPGVADPMEFEGVETNEMIGDLWSVTDFRGNFGGMEFRGHGRMGYNPDNKKFEGTWFDSTNPWCMSISGTYDESTQTLTTFSVGKDATGTEKKGKSTLVYKGADSRVMTAYAGEGEGDEMVKEMEITYTRKK